MKNYFCLEAIEFQCNFVFEDLESTKISLYEPVSSQKYEMDTGRKFVTLQYFEVCPAAWDEH